MRWPWMRRRLSRKELGALGERHAARYLSSHGLRIIEGNFRTKQGEIDLIAREAETLVFVEVRTRTREDDVFTPLDSVNARKQAQVARMARYYQRARRLEECYIRFDVVEVIASVYGEVLDVRHFPGAFVEETSLRR